MHRAALAFLALPVLASGKDLLDLVLLPEGQYAGGKCMNGTQAGYYYGPPSSGSSTLWVIFLKGGGGCSTEEDCKKWAAGLGGTKGGSTNWTAEKDANPNFLSPDRAKNPDFHDAHHVLVPYCTGDGHMGQVSSPTQADHWGYYFDGHLNVKAIAHHISATISGAAGMQRVLFTGSSAGGAGVFHNCDFLQNYLTELGLKASVMCSPFSGWFMPGNLQEGADRDSPPTLWQNWSVGKVPPTWEHTDPYDSYLHPDCVAAHGADVGKCFSVHNMYQYIKAPVYAVQDTFDTSVLFTISQLPTEEMSTPRGQEFVAYIGNCTKASMSQIERHPQGKQGDGMFLTSCLDHAVGGSDTTIGGSKKGSKKFDALGDWFFGRGKPLVSKDTCDSTSPYLPCNPGCNGLPHGAEAACQDRLESVCGEAKTRQACLACARKHAADLRAANCTEEVVKETCSCRAKFESLCGDVDTNGACLDCVSENSDAGCAQSVMIARCPAPAALISKPQAEVRRHRFLGSTSSQAGTVLDHLALIQDHLVTVEGEKEGKEEL